MYNLIGIIIGGTIASIGFFIESMLLWEFLKGYVTEENELAENSIALKTSKLVAKCVCLDGALFDKPNSFLLGLMAIVLGLVCIKLWPIVLFGGAAYGILRMLRFAHRIKRTITGLFKKKKCLKDLGDDDQPKMEF